jgi:hypothetical protein
LDETENTMKILAFFLALVLPATAGNINIVQIGDEKPLTLKISCEGREQNLTLQIGEQSGPFTLPQKPSVFAVKDEEIEPLELAASKESRILILHQKEKKLHWHVVLGHEAKETSSLRAINLSANPTVLIVGDNRHDLTAGQALDLGALKSHQASAAIDGQKKVSTSSEDPTSFIAVIHDTEAGPKLHFIADR